MNARADVAVSKTDLARLLGRGRKPVRLSYVRKLELAGRLVPAGDGRYWRDASLERVARTRDPSRQYVAERRDALMDAVTAVDSGPVAPEVESKGASVESAPRNGTPHTYTEARAIRERYNALMAELNYQRLAGRLCDVEEVRRAATTAGTELRAALEQLPDRLAPLLAAETDERLVHARLVESIEELLDDLSGRWQSLAQDLADLDPSA